MKNYSYLRADSAQGVISPLSKNATSKFLGGGMNLIDLMREDIEQRTRSHHLRTACRLGGGEGWKVNRAAPYRTDRNHHQRALCRAMHLSGAASVWSV
jgi:hypothetical protein